MGTFEQHKSHSAYWFNTANHLHVSAAAIYHAMELEGTFPKDRFGLSEGVSMSADGTGAFRMLGGMSIECMLKGLLMEQGKAYGTHHNLLKHAKDAGVTFSKDDEGLLAILTHAIYWDGRYPHPLKEDQWDEFSDLTWEHLKDEEPFGDGIFLYHPNEKLNWEGYDRLWSMVLGELLAIAKWLDRS